MVFFLSWGMVSQCLRLSEVALVRLQFERCCAYLSLTSHRTVTLCYLSWLLRSKNIGREARTALTQSTQTVWHLFDVMLEHISSIILKQEQRNTDGRFATIIEAHRVLTHPPCGKSCSAEEVHFTTIASASTSSPIVVFVYDDW